MRAPRSLTLSFALLPLAVLGVGCVEPGFAADAAPTGPALVVDAALSEAGDSATLAVRSVDVGALFGISFHVLVDDLLVRIDEAAIAPALLGDDTGSVDGGARRLASINARNGDAALGATRVDPAAGDVDVPDAVVATLSISARTAATSSIAIVDALGRRADASFVPLAVGGGAITFSSAGEAP